ncbi:hypothetical protein [Actinomadura sp. 3N508]|uniref:hypothetical protein n=1 Tax=Actinomadura sp. 3N508 TaxID=3375153 RepID=UPI003796447C
MTVSKTKPEVTKARSAPVSATRRFTAGAAVAAAQRHGQVRAHLYTHGSTLPLVTRAAEAATDCSTGGVALLLTAVIGRRAGAPPVTLVCAVASFAAVVGPRLGRFRAYGPVRDGWGPMG